MPGVKVFLIRPVSRNAFGNNHFAEVNGLVATVVIRGDMPMIPDCETDIVYISSLLKERHPEIDSALKCIFGTKLHIIADAKDIWCRDYMPIQLGVGQFVQFRYDPSYLKDDSVKRTENGAALVGIAGCPHVKLKVDGGNVVHWRDTAILTDRI